jgi:hypothetical protein
MLKINTCSDDIAVAFFRPNMSTATSAEMLDTSEHLMWFIPENLSS